MYMYMYYIHVFLLCLHAVSNRLYAWELLFSSGALWSEKEDLKIPLVLLLQHGHTPTAPAREQPAVIQTPTKTQQPSETQPPSSKPQPPSSKPQPPSEPQPPHPALTGLQKTTPTAAEEEGQEMKEAAKSAKLDAGTHHPPYYV